MIQLKQGNLLDMKVEALVNTVNCDGFMGKGIALQFKKAFPENFKAYERACRAGRVSPGKMFVFEIGSLVNPKYIINFPTKRHWRGKSRLEDIATGLKALVEEIQKRRIASVAIPPLGCGFGGLVWRDVRPMIEKALAELSDVDVSLFGPGETPDAAIMPIRTPRPKMTIARALFIKLIQQYAQLAYRLTLLEIQKLAYFLQEAGQPLKLNYVAHHYGPYAHNLNKVLEVLEGHFIRGYGDSQKPDVEIRLMNGSVDVAEAFLDKHRDAKERLEKVGRLIDGFETPYGMELLSSVHWVASYSDPPIRASDESIDALYRWSERKRMFRPEHIRIAWNRLHEEGWIPESTKN